MTSARRRTAGELRLNKFLIQDDGTGAQKPASSKLCTTGGFEAAFALHWHCKRTVELHGSLLLD